MELDGRRADHDGRGGDVGCEGGGEEGDPGHYVEVGGSEHVLHAALLGAEGAELGEGTGHEGERGEVLREVEPEGAGAEEGADEALPRLVRGEREELGLEDFLAGGEPTEVGGGVVADDERDGEDEPELRAGRCAETRSPTNEWSE